MIAGHDAWAALKLGGNNAVLHPRIHGRERAAPPDRKLHGRIWIAALDGRRVHLVFVLDTPAFRPGRKARSLLVLNFCANACRTSTWTCIAPFATSWPRPPSRKCCSGSSRVCAA